MKTFEDLEFSKIVSPYLSGVRSRLMFENGFGVSVVCTDLSYGGKDGLYEIAVLNSQGDITYDTELTNDVIGWLDKDKVTEIMLQVQKIGIV